MSRGQGTSPFAASQRGAACRTAIRPAPMPTCRAASAAPGRSSICERRGRGGEGPLAGSFWTSPDSRRTPPDGGGAGPPPCPPCGGPGPPRCRTVLPSRPRPSGRPGGAPAAGGGSSRVPVAGPAPRDGPGRRSPRRPRPERPTTTAAASGRPGGSPRCRRGGSPPIPRLRRPERGRRSRRGRRREGGGGPRGRRSSRGYGLARGSGGGRRRGWRGERRRREKKKQKQKKEGGRKEECVPCGGKRAAGSWPCDASDGS
mmetsp:Transcript_27342/g.62768  ORF Transcript_27342/g.62768 Transcript_27342/m.62768 type:complete len:258 (-) Transcript_27342:30-803(-)